MPRKNLNRETIINIAIELINQNGYSEFTLQSLSNRLDIKPPSLYNHFKNLNELTIEIFKKLVSEYNTFKAESVGDLRREEALFAYANAVRTYSQKFPEQFELIMLFPSLIDNDEIKIPVVIGTLMTVLDHYQVSEAEKYHFQRIFRSFMRGFIKNEKVGFFRNNDISKDESYDFAIRTFVIALEAREAAYKKQNIAQ